jgi:aminoglycoside phosphotransferase
LEPAPGGAANLAFEIFDPARSGVGPVGFLRCEAGTGLGGGRFGLRHEGEVLAVAARLGFPVAEVLGTLEEPTGLVLELVAGTSRPDVAEAETVGPEYLALVARLHRQDTAAFPLEPMATMAEAVADDLAWWTRLAEDREVMDRPILRLASRVLAATMPTGDRPPAVVHGDVGAGNFMVREGRVSAMLDWELTHLGDPHEDLAWLWMRGAHTEFGEPATRLREYETAAGSVLDADRLCWHLAFVMWKSCVGTHARLRELPDRSTLNQTVVQLTYDALLGSQLVQLLGGSFGLLAVTPEVADDVRTHLTERMLDAEDLSREGRLIVEYLRDGAAQSEWERDCLERDARARLGVSAGDLRDYIDTASDDRLLSLALVVAAAADRAALAMPKAVRRIERAQRIGLGTGQPTRASLALGRSS